VPYKTTVQITKGDKTDNGEIIDLSINGIKVIYRGLMIDDVVTLKFGLPGVIDPIIIEGEVRWVSQEETGIRFTKGLRAAHTYALMRLARDD
jgi:hypothetical protein